MAFRSDAKQTVTTRLESKSDNKNASTHPASLFGNASSLQDMLYDELLKTKGNIQKLLEYIVQENMPEYQRQAIKNVCLPRIANHLCQAAIQGEYKEVDMLLTCCPSLLLEKSTVMDYSGREHLDRTVYQLVLGAKDKNVKNTKGDKIVVDGMIEMIEEKHFPKLSDYQVIMQKQYEEQYPVDYKEIEAKQDACDDAAFNAVMNIIKKANNDICEMTNTLEDRVHKIRRKEKSPRADELKSLTRSIYQADTKETFEAGFDQLKIYLRKERLVNDSFDFTVLEAIYRFRNYWESKTKRPITIGKHFNHSALDKAGTEYDANYMTFGAGRDDKFNAPKNILYWQKIFGYIERFVPACDAQIIAQGPWHLLEDGEKSRRALDWRSGDGSYFPLDSDPNLELGHNCAGGWLGRLAAALGAITGVSPPFQNLCQAKTPAPSHYAMERQSNAEHSLCNSLTRS